MEDGTLRKRVALLTVELIFFLFGSGLSGLGYKFIPDPFDGFDMFIA
jgi:hypothetical protein